MSLGTRLEASSLRAAVLRSKIVAIVIAHTRVLGSGTCALLQFLESECKHVRGRLQTI